MIYHLTLEPEFRAGSAGDGYRPARFAQDGFVHCAERASVLDVADDYFADVAGVLLLLEIDPVGLGAELRFEAPAALMGAGGGRAHLRGVTAFPHVYGPIELAAIVRVGALGRTASGFTWPRRFAHGASYLAEHCPGVAGGATARGHRRASAPQ